MQFKISPLPPHGFDGRYATFFFLVESAQPGVYFEPQQDYEILDLGPGGWATEALQAESLAKATLNVEKRWWEMFERKKAGAA